jgi:chromosome segregation ATPase
MFTLSIYYFARMAAERNWENSQMREKNKRLDSLANEVQQLNKKLHQSDATLQQKESERQQIAAILQQREMDLLEFAGNLKEVTATLQQTEKELQQLRIIQQQIAANCTCDKCGTTFQTEASKRSHAGKCKGINKAA